MTAGKATGFPSCPPGHQVARINGASFSFFPHGHFRYLPSIRRRRPADFQQAVPQNPAYVRKGTGQGPHYLPGGGSPPSGRGYRGPSGIHQGGRHSVSRGNQRPHRPARGDHGAHQPGAQGGFPARPCGCISRVPSARFPRGS